jgi:hypothetical protein
MTNIAFTSLVILVLAFPGYVFSASYFSNEFTRQVLAKSWTDDLAKAIIFSLPFHVVGILLIEWLQHCQVIHHTLDHEIAFRMLAGEFSKTGSDYNLPMYMVLRRLYQNWPYLLSYYVLILLAAWAVGHFFRHMVWEYELDVRFPRTLGFRNRWIYHLLGRGQLEGVRAKDTITLLDALTDEPAEAPGKTRLYRGVVAGFTTDEMAAPREVILTAARRSKFKKLEGKEEFEFSWQRIEPGDYFAMKYSEIKNLNITYRAADEAIPPGAVGTAQMPPASPVPAETSDPTGQTFPAS